VTLILYTIELCSNFTHSTAFVGLASVGIRRVVCVRCLAIDWKEVVRVEDEVYILL
jgi:hypothetical protein